MIRIAMALRNPEDEYHRDMGTTIAKNRLLHEDKDLSVFRLMIDNTRRGHLNYVSKETMETAMDMFADIVKNNVDIYV